MNPETVLPDRFLKCMSSEDRKSLGKAGVTADEAQAKADAKSEKEMHETFIQWLNLNRIIYRHDRMDKKTTGQVGFPDFVIWFNRRTAAIEMKVPGGEMSPEQMGYALRFHCQGIPHMIAYSAAQAISFARQALEI